MIKLREETVINTSPSPIFNFLTTIDKKYKIWHPKSHFFCKTIKGMLGQSGAVFHFLETLGVIPLYLIVKITKVQKKVYLEYKPIFPLSL
jgi:hypothetical protein